MSPVMQASLPLGLHTHNNKGLFAAHYLDHPERLQALDEWRQATGVEEAFRTIAHLYSDKAVHFNKRINEHQTEHDFIRPVLDVLWREQQAGDCYQVQVTIPNVDVRRQPDYSFFCTAQDRRNAEARKGSLDYWLDVPALGDAKAWFASLDKQRGADDNPTAQISNYLYRSRVRWGILTNGRIWRLYEREKSSAGGIYYEVDLEELLQHGDFEAFRYFYLFFRRAAFLPDHTGISFIERVFQGSVDYATQVGDRLKESVYDALRLLMNGFFEYPANRLNRQDPDTVKLVHENCLIVLYRLLFLLYAEDRNLLPRDDGPYANYSLYHLQQAINQHLRTGGTYLPMSRRLWGELTDLFQLIDTGFEQGDIPAYNGGLFSPSNYPRIAYTLQSGVGRWEIGDHRLAHVIDMLAYQRDYWDSAGTQDVDYNTLDVQHLGSIYEGLLELQPHIATEAMVETLVDGKPSFKPAREVASSRAIRGQPPRPINAGEVYLVTDRGERKATGSYYTPTYIVDYIVEHTVGPLTEEAAKAVAALRSEVSREIAKLERTRREWQKSSAADAASQIEDLSKLIEDQKRRLLEPYLTLKILDPAMGSGHFLVGAANFLSLAMATDPNLFTLSAIGDEDSQAFYKRLVVERCLYGVDVNALAVELAKLSLWLHTVSRDKALSFLDHHLRCGNSLIGARVEDDLMREPPQFNARGRRTNADSQQLVLGFTEALTATHLQYFLDTFRKIVETPSGDAVMERQKDELYRTMDAVRDRFRSIANCWLAPFFGVPVTPQQYERAVNALRGTDPERHMLAQEGWFKDAQAIAQQNRFFHWELEFPEVFFDAHGLKPKEERGFHTAIGKSPYVNAIELNKILSPYEKPFWKERFESASGAYDIYILFIELSVRMTRNQCLASMITPNKFLSAPYAVAFRQFICKSAMLLHLLNLSHIRIFEDHSIYPVVTVIENSLPIDHYDICIEIPRSIKNHSDITVLTQISENLNKLPKNICGFLISEHLPLILKGEQISVQLQHCSVVHASSTASEIDGYEDALTNNGGANCKKFINTGLIDRYDTLWSVDSLTHKGNVFLTPYLDLSNPAVTEQRKSQYSKSKIIFAKMAKRTEAFLDESGEFASANTNFAYNSEYDLHYLLSVLNSNLMSILYSGYFGALIMSGGYFQFQAPQLRVLPIRRIIFTTPSNERPQLLEQGKQFHERCLPEGDNDCVLGFVDRELAQTPERADVVHDLLTFLAEQMIEMNKQKQTEVKGFLTWLERAIGAAVDDLRNKTKVKAYHAYDFESLWAVLKQNRWSLAVNPDTRTVQDTIEREYNASIAKLSPLKANIAATDRLIDLIVYRLYGLTEEETAIVEGHASANTERMDVVQQPALP